MSTKETFSINGEALLGKIKEIIAEGKASRITISNKEGKELMTFPLSVGLFGMILAPVFAAVGTLAALVTECTITVEREEEDKEEEGPKE
ncbi:MULTISPECIES: DUF4342 domain-containing protein [Mucilaginibacter]|uniref:DUF4342 domain-containing protein n=1 Tax=Mucilaginibacter rubeus TaxID=2027860 RepID=A0A5C1HSM0_9SPHI|nr:MULTISPECIES: DUF4342 domain-containing protein [Mucilaginibacter]QEM08555.1 DUF4342 domain-containing protein [Mucilaginibacter rubeus]